MKKCSRKLSHLNLNKSSKINVKDAFEKTESTEPAENV